MGDFLFKHLRGFGNFSCLDAGGAYINFSDATRLNHRTNSLEIGIEAPFIEIMGMADIVADHWSFSTDGTFFWHIYTPNKIALSKLKPKMNTTD